MDTDKLLQNRELEFEKLYTQFETNSTIDILITYNIFFKPDGDIKNDIKTRLKNQNKRDKLVNKPWKRIINYQRSKSKEYFNNLSQYVTNPKHIEYIPCMHATVTKDQLQQLEKDDRILFVQESNINTMKLIDSVPLIQADKLWNRGWTGKHVYVAVLDSGCLNSHEMLSNTIVDEYCFSGNNGNYVEGSLCPNRTSYQEGTNAANPPSASLFNEGGGHGTHVAGIISGHSYLKGCAPCVKIIAIQVFTNIQGSIGAYDSDLINALLKVYSLRDTYNIVAINMSLGGGLYIGTCDNVNPAFTNVLSLLRSVGIMPIIASGNSYCKNAISTPGCISSAVAIGATDKNDVVAIFSNMSDKVELLAPGVDIQSAWPYSVKYKKLSGTSMATPHVTASYALLRQANPEATIEELLEMLKQEGKSIYDEYSKLTIKRIQLLNTLYQIGETGHRGAPNYLPQLPDWPRSQYGAPCVYWSILKRPDPNYKYKP